MSSPVVISSAPPPLPRRVPYPTLLGSVVILLVAAFFARGLPAINARIRGMETVPAGTHLGVGRGVSYRTVEGWAIDPVRTKPDETSTLVREASSLTITTFDWTASQPELIARLKRLVEGLQPLHVYGEPAPCRTAAGLEGVSFGIHGDNVEGRIWVFMLPGGQQAIGVRARGVPGSFDDALRDARAMVDGIVVEAKS